MTDSDGAGLRSVDLFAGARVLFAAGNDASLYAWELYGRCLGSDRDNQGLPRVIG